MKYLSPSDAFALAIIAERPKAAESKALAHQLKGRAGQIARALVEGKNEPTAERIRAWSASNREV